MVFMRFAIDVLFVDKNDCVVGVVEHVRPFRFSPIFFKSKYAIELPEGEIVQTKTALGDKIQIEGVYS